MKRIFFVLFALSLSLGLMAQVLSCYDVQYTTTADGNSPYDGQSVTIEAIVTAVTVGSSFYIGDATGGPWSGLYVYDRTNSNIVHLGDKVLITGTIDEYKQADYWPSALTELVSVSSCEIVSSSNPMPPATLLTTAQLSITSSAISEQWEGVLVRFTDVQIKTAPDSYGQFKVADISGSQSMIDDGFFPVASQFQIIVNDWWFQITGIVDFHGSSSAGYKVNPRNASDLRKIDSVEYSQISIENTNANLNTPTEVNVLTSHVKMDWYVASYTLSFKIDPTRVIFHDLEVSGTLTPVKPTPTVSANGDTISFTVLYQEGLTAPNDDMVLIKLVLEPLVYGQTIIDLLSFKYDNTEVSSITDGKLMTKIQENTAYLKIGNATNNKNIFNPYMNEKLTIEYGCKAGILGKALIRIYDAQGRLVFTPVNVNLPNSAANLSISSYEWNGRDANMNLLPVGLYYCHLEVSNRSSGATERTVQPIVIKSILK